MVDIVDRETRSRMMSGIRGSNTKPELALRRALHAAGFRFRLHDRRLPGRPDIVLPRFRAAIFVHGCFWHRHEGCRFATTPATRPDFWAAKFEDNRMRDSRALRDLAAIEWRVATIWECAIRESGAEPIAGELGNWLRSTRQSIVIGEGPRRSLDSDGQGSGSRSARGKASDPRPLA